MATTTNFGWTTPDDTDLVKDGAAAIRTLGSSIDTTLEALNPSTTLGDVEYRSSTANTNTRLGIGSTGDVLTVAGGVPTWAAPSAGGSNFTLLNPGGTALPAGTSLTISGISGVNEIFIFGNNYSSAGAGANARLRINGDTTSKYGQFGGYVQFSSSYASTIGTTFNIDVNGLSYYEIGNLGSNAASVGSFGVRIVGSNATGTKMIQSTHSATAGGGQNQQHSQSMGVYTGTSAITSINISSNADFDAGSIYVYASA